MKKKITKELFQSFSHSYLRIDWHNLLQIWYVDLPRSGASVEQIWLNWDKWSQSYIGVKITFLILLSIYSQCDTITSWAARHTTVCLEASTNCTNVGNYHPVSLTSPTCKILESIIRDNIQEHLMTNIVICGFTSQSILLFAKKLNHIANKKSRIFN